MEAYRNKVSRVLLHLLLISFGFIALATTFFFPVSGVTAVFDVTNSTELQNALTAAQSNGEDDTINIAAGTFGTGGTTFTYGPTESRSLTVT
jgi:hypothetical protein